jgi:hypothetical protein
LWKDDVVYQAGTLSTHDGQAAAQAVYNLVTANNALQNFKLRDARKRLPGAIIDQFSTYELFSGIIDNPSSVLGPNAIVGRDYTFDSAKSTNCTSDCPVVGDYFWFDCESSSSPSMIQRECCSDLVDLSGFTNIDVHPSAKIMQVLAEKVASKLGVRYKS